MSRKPPSETFTRFTSNSPHASSKTSSQQPSSRSSPSQFSYRAPSSQPNTPQSNTTTFSSSGPPGETPAEKVARLRAAARLAKERGNLTLADRIIDRGRIWADRAHRFGTYGLIGLTGVSTVVAIYGLTGLIAHNRRQKRAWIEREMGRLDDARQAFLRGEANAEQLHLLEQERAGGEMERQRDEEKRRKKEQGMWNRFLGLIGADNKQGKDASISDDKLLQAQTKTAQLKASRSQTLEEAWLEGEVKPQAPLPQAQGQPLAAPTPKTILPAPSGIKGVGVDSKDRPVPAGRAEQVVQRVEGERRTGEREVAERTGIRGGPLDLLADNVAAAVTPGGESSGRGWISWLRGTRS